MCACIGVVEENSMLTWSAADVNCYLISYYYGLWGSLHI